jgi:DNA-3-methyladenine glycosylase
MPGDPEAGGVIGGTVLRPRFFERSADLVAPDLLGKVLVRELPDGEVRWGRLVEVEAYLGEPDQASHARRGRTKRTAPMYGPPGHAYVYFVYGMHWCLNFVCRQEGTPHAVLVRALEPGPGTPRASGPGLVCRALAIDGDLDGAPLQPPDLYLLDDGARPEPIVTTPRIGVDYAGEWAARALRYAVASPHLSRKLPSPPVQDPFRTERTRSRGR